MTISKIKYFCCILIFKCKKTDEAEMLRSTTLKVLSFSRNYNLSTFDQLCFCPSVLFNTLPPRKKGERNESKQFEKWKNLIHIFVTEHYFLSRCL